MEVYLKPWWWRSCLQQEPDLLSQTESHLCEFSALTEQQMSVSRTGRTWELPGTLNHWALHKILPPPHLFVCGRNEKFTSEWWQNDAEADIISSICLPCSSPTFSELTFMVTFPEPKNVTLEANCCSWKKIKINDFHGNKRITVVGKKEITQKIALVPWVQWSLPPI